MRISDWSSDVCSSDLFGLDKLYLFLSQMRALGGKVLQQSHDVITARRSLRTARGARRAVDPTIIVHRRPPSSLRAVWRSEEHTSELQSLMRTSYAVFCLKKKTSNNNITHTN